MNGIIDLFFGNAKNSLSEHVCMMVGKRCQIMLVHNPRQLTANRGNICRDPIGTFLQTNKTEIASYQREN